MSNRNKKRVKNQGNSKTGNQGNPRNKQAMKLMDQDDPKFAKLNKYNDGNDPDYYFTDKALAEQAATFPFVYFLGTKKTIGHFDVPTVEVLKLNPSMGVTPSDEDGNVNIQTGANMAAQKLYTRLSVASGRTASYQPNDVLMAVGAATSLAEGIEYARRFFGVATTYSARNRVFAWRILSMIAGANESFGQDFVTKMADYRMELNMIITKLNQIPLFADMGYVRKSIEMYQKLYMDETSDTAQIYVYSPHSLWKIDETTEGGTTLKTVILQSSTFQGILDKLNACADALLNSTTLNMVYADMFNYQAKFSTNFITLDYVLEGYSVIPEYNERALQQIHNAVITSEPLVTTSKTWGDYKITSGNDVISTAETGLIIYNPLFNSANAAKGLIFDFETSTPDLVDRIDNIKFAALKGIAVRNGTDWGLVNATLPDHYIVEAQVYGATPTDFVRVQNNRICTAGASINTPAFEFSAMGGDYGILTTGNIHNVLLSKFNHNFLGIVFSTNGTSDDVTSVIGDLNYFTSMSEDHFRRITDLEYQGLFELR